MSIRGFCPERQRVERVSIGMIAPLRVAARSKSGTTTKKLGKEKNAIRQDNRVANGSEGRRIYFISELYRVDCHGPTEWMLCPARTRSFRPHMIPPPHRHHLPRNLSITRDANLPTLLGYHFYFRGTLRTRSAVTSDPMSEKD